MKPGTLQEDGLLLLQKRSVGGEDDPKSGIMCKTEKDFQQGVAQWLTHKVKIKEVRKGMQLRKKHAKFIFSHCFRCALRSGAERAAEIAYVGYFKIYLHKTFHMRTSKNVMIKALVQPVKMIISV